MHVINSFHVVIIALSHATMDLVVALLRSKLPAVVEKKSSRLLVVARRYALQNAKNSFLVGINVIFSVTLAPAKRHTKARLVVKNAIKNEKIAVIFVHKYAIQVNNVKIFPAKLRF